MSSLIFFWCDWIMHSLFLLLCYGLLPSPSFSLFLNINVLPFIQLLLQFQQTRIKEKTTWKKTDVTKESEKHVDVHVANKKATTTTHKKFKIYNIAENC